MKGTSENPNTIEIKIRKSAEKDELTGEATIEYTMEASPATKLIGLGGYLKWVGVDEPVQNCGISKILTR